MALRTQAEHIQKAKRTGCKFWSESMPPTIGNCELESDAEFEVNKHSVPYPSAAQVSRRNQGPHSRIRVPSGLMSKQIDQHRLLLFHASKQFNLLNCATRTHGRLPSKHQKLADRYNQHLLESTSKIERIRILLLEAWRGLEGSWESWNEAQRGVRGVEVSSKRKRG
jgi:hypothetical protein